MFPVGVYNVEDYPLNWIGGTYYSTYKGNTFQVSLIENVKSEAEYNAVTNISLGSQSLTTDFTNTLLSKFNNLVVLVLNNNSITLLDVTSVDKATVIYCHNNQISTLDVTQCSGLIDLRCFNNSISVLDVSSLINLQRIYCYNNQISTLDVSNLNSLTQLYCYTNQLDAATNSQILIDLDANGKSNGILSSSIFGGGSLTTAGQTAKTNLLSKGWTIVGI